MESERDGGRIRASRGREPTRLRRIVAPTLLAILTLTACRATAPAPNDRPDFTEDDVQFMRGMIIHHAQALVMTSLVPERAGSEGVRLIARRIEISQRGEIGMMRDWLRERGLEAPVPDTIFDPGTHGDSMTMAGMTHAAGAGAAGAAGQRQLMPGMLTREQMLRLAQAIGKEFDRLFLKLMIQHHQGALTMVGNLYAAGAAQEPETNNFVAHVDSGQRMEIRRMRSMLEKRTEGDPRR